MTEPQEQVSNSDEQFDPARAQALISNLKNEIAGLKQDRTPQDDKDRSTIAALKREIAQLKPQADQYAALEEASKSETQRASEEAARAQRERDEARADMLRYKVAAAHGISSEDDFALLGTGDEETLTARATRLQGLLSQQTVVQQMQAEIEALKAGKPLPRARSVEQLRPGATPQNDQLTEDDVLYNSLYGA